MCYNFNIYVTLYGNVSGTNYVDGFYHYSIVYCSNYKDAIKNVKANNVHLNFENVVLMDEPKKNIYPMPVICKDKDEVYVGRVRRDFSVDNGLNMWVVADNIRKGAATNAVQILEKILEYKKEGKM